MAKYIERDQLVEHLTRMMGARQIDRLPRSGYAKAIQDVDGCPAADVVPVTRGRWIPESNRPRSWAWRCSLCGRTAYQVVPARQETADKRCALRYCPHCGARMDGGEGDA